MFVPRSGSYDHTAKVQASTFRSETLNSQADTAHRFLRTLLAAAAQATSRASQNLIGKGAQKICITYARRSEFHKRSIAAVICSHL